MFFKTFKILQTLKKNTESKIDAHTCVFNNFNE